MAKKKKKKYPKDKLFYSEIIISTIVLLVVLFLALFAHIDIKHTVSFNSNGGTTITLKKVKHNGVVQEPEPPTREGYIFLGWYHNDELYSFDTKIKEDIELQAKWEEVVYSEIESIELNLSDFSIKRNQQLQLIPIIKPISANNEKIYWDSSDSDIVEVDSTGLVKTKKEGTVIITVSSLTGVSDQVKITVSNKAINIKNISFSTETINIKKGSTQSLELTILPSNASNMNLVWTSDNPNIVSVDNLGNVTGKEIGIATVTVVSLDGNKIAKCQINVIK